MTLQERTIVVPISGCLVELDLYFPVKYNHEVLNYTLDLRAWLAINGLSLTGSTITTTRSLKVTNQSFMVRNLVNVGIQLELAYGIPELTETIHFRLHFAQGETTDIIVKIPIAALPGGLCSPLPGTLAIGDMSLSVGEIVLAGFTNS